MELVFPILLNTIKEEFNNPIFIEKSNLTLEDKTFIEKEINMDCTYDSFGLRKKTWDNRKSIIVKKKSNVKIIAILESIDQITNIDWELWFHIINLFGKKNLRVIFFVNSTKREFPENEFIPGAINGGYAYPCDGDTIVIYREEDATRVLIHELFHFYCTDIDGTIDEKEASTEAWAELVLCAVLSKGNKSMFEEFLKLQRGWMEKQNEIIKKYNKENSVWRYTIEKEKIWDKWNICNKKNTNNITLRLGFM